jgi:proline dehydrogenase
MASDEIWPSRQAMSSMRSRLRDVRYALPQKLEPFCRGPSIEAIERRCASLERIGLSATFGYFQASQASPDSVAATILAALKAWRRNSSDTYLSIKAPPLGFNRRLIGQIASAAAEARLALLFDAHAPKDADDTLALVSSLLPHYPGIGFALPARWRRSEGDAASFKNSNVRIRLVKGEWTDPSFDGDIARAFLDRADQLAGREAPVAIATHDPDLAEQALRLLLEAGTPCELEQLRGLPRRRTMAVAKSLDVRVRIYLPFGPGWWPYAVDKALARPYLLSWALSDWLGQPDRTQTLRPKGSPAAAAMNWR